MNRCLFKKLIAFRAASSLALLIATVGLISLAQAADELPSQDQALARALENHPDIVAAKAKVALVEAELYGKRMEVSRQVLSLYGSLAALDSQIEVAKASISHARSEFEQYKLAAASGVGNPSAAEKLAAALQAAEGKLVQAKGQREQAEKELRLMVGAAPGTTEAKFSDVAATPPRQAPQGPIVGTWKAASEEQVKISFTDTPLVEVLIFLSDKTGIKFSVQGLALEGDGLAVDMPISLTTNDVSVSAAMQGFEDAYPDLQFVLRDYGVLLTTKNYAEENGYMPALEVGKESTDGK